MKVIAIAAISVDGFITRHDEPGSGFTSPEDKRFFHQAVLDFDSLVFGAVNYELSREWIRNHLRRDQLKIVMTREPERYADQVRPGELEFTSEAPEVVVRQLRERGQNNLCLLGGGQIYGLFLKHQAVDELWLTVEPVIFGEGTKLAEAKVENRLALISQQKLNDSTLLLKYAIRRP